MKKTFFLFSALLAISFSSFAATCTVEGNGYRATARCNSCTYAEACAYAYQAINAMK